MRWSRLLSARGSGLLQGYAGVATDSSPTIRVPGPSCYPLVGSLPDILQDKEFDKDQLHKYFMRLFNKYGPVVKVQFPAQAPMVLLLRPEDCNKVMKRTMENPVRTPMETLRHARYSNPYYEKKAGIVTENGAEWSRVRKKINVPILKPKNVHYYLEKVDQVTLDFLDRLESLRDSNGEVQADMKVELANWSLECVSLVALNQRLGCLDPNDPQCSDKEWIRKAATNFMNAIKECESGLKLWKIYPTRCYKQLVESMETLTAVCEEVVEKVEQDIGEIESRGETPCQEGNLVKLLLMEPTLSRKDVITFMVDLLPGGTETTSDNMSVVLYQLAKNPEAQARVQEEVDRVLGRNREPITPQRLASLTYTKAAFKECNRLMPPMLGPVRILQEDMVLRNYLLKKGWMVFLTSALTAHDENEYSRATEFLPERWLRDKPLGHIHPYCARPFSYGSRMCCGKRVAEQQIYTLLARLLQRYNIEWKHEDLKRSYKFVFSPESPLKFTLTER